MTELARSIAAVGVIEPCLGTPIEGEHGRFRLVAGHRRHAGAVKVGIPELPCVVRQLSEAEVVETQLVENLQRLGLGVLEVRRAATCACAVSATQPAAWPQRVGRSERHVRDRLVC